MLSLMSYPWFLWSVGLLVVFPLAVILLGETKQHLAHGGITAYETPLNWLQNGCLPLLFILLLLRFVVGYDSSHLAVRIADTAFWIVFINFALALVNVAFFEGGRAAGLHNRIPKLLLDLLRFFVVLVSAAVVVSTVWGVDLGSLLTALGVGSLVIGLALQDTLSSIFSGIAMISTRQLRVGDYVVAGGEEGTVTNMNWRTVTLRSGMGDDVILPNSMVSKDKLTVIGGDRGQRVLGVDVRLAYDHAPETVLELMERTARASIGMAKNPAPVARLSAYEDNGIRYTLWMTSETLETAFRAKHEFLCNFWYAARRMGLVMPGQVNINFPAPHESRHSLPSSAADLARLAAQSGALPRSADVLGPVMAHARRLEFRPGEVLLPQDAVATHVYAVVEGKGEAVYAPEAAPAITVHTFEPGQLILFKSLFRGGDVPFSVRAASELTVIAIPAAEFKQLLATDLALAHQIELSLSAREDAAAALLSDSFPGQFEANGAADRVQYLRDMFRV